MVFEIEDGVLYGVKVDGNCRSNIIIPDSVRRIGENAFCGMDIKSVFLPFSVEIIGRSAFCGCKRLLAVYTMHSVLEIAENAFEGCTSLEFFGGIRSVKFIGKNAFCGCKSLRDVFLDNVRTIDDGAFSNCSLLESVFSLYAIEHIGKDAFCGCKSLVNVDMNKPQIAYSPIFSIDDFAFCDTKSLKRIRLPDNLSALGKGVFYNSGVEDVSFIEPKIKRQRLKTLDCIKEQTFFNTPLKSICLPENIKHIENDAFGGCKKLERAYIPQNTTCADRAFDENTKILTY